MHSILHRITIETTPEKLYSALTTQQGLSAWWTKTKTNGDKIASTNSFFFGPDCSHQVDMKVETFTINERVVWQWPLARKRSVYFLNNTR
jgi:uncharacterized protein YndB with AHSA1/START domain